MLGFENNRWAESRCLWLGPYYFHQSLGWSQFRGVDFENAQTVRALAWCGGFVLLKMMPFGFTVGVRRISARLWVFHLGIVMIHVWDIGAQDVVGDDPFLFDWR
ncbi:MAG: hypothetical protein EOP84_07590 [Verrucomicrobiaceae bacterium]|nr:MAG: hypothetical protein EOP84_07590 [Verrucomicrobiaceae bacterium]